MTRYAISRPIGDHGIEYLAACYEPTGSGIVYTPLRSDACTYATIEKAAEVAVTLQRNLCSSFMLTIVED